jgi:hypothetical protein
MYLLEAYVENAIRVIRQSFHIQSAEGTFSHPGPLSWKTTTMPFERRCRFEGRNRQLQTLTSPVILNIIWRGILKIIWRSRPDLSMALSVKRPMSGHPRIVRQSGAADAKPDGMIGGQEDGPAHDDVRPSLVEPRHLPIKKVAT